MTTPAENRPSDELPLPPPPPPPAADTPAADTQAADTRADTRLAPTRTSMVWLGVWAGVVVLILLIVFIAQNTSNVRIAFFGLEGQIPLALALLIAGVAGAIIAMAVAAGRIIQLRKMLRRGP